MQTGANIQIEGSASDGGCQLLGCSQGSHTPLRPPPSPQPRGDKVPMGQENKTGVSPCRENPNLRLGDPNSAPTLHGHNPPPLPPGLLCPPSLLWGGTQRPHPLQLPQPCPVLPSPHPLPHICSPMFPALTSPPLCLLPRVPFPTSPALCLQSHITCSVLFPMSSSSCPLPYVCCPVSHIPFPMSPAVSSSPRPHPCPRSLPHIPFPMSAAVSSPVSPAPCSLPHIPRQCPLPHVPFPVSPVLYLQPPPPCVLPHILFPFSSPTSPAPCPLPYVSSPKSLLFYVSSPTSPAPYPLLHVSSPTSPAPCHLPYVSSPKSPVP